MKGTSSVEDWNVSVVSDPFAISMTSPFLSSRFSSLVASPLTVALNLSPPPSVATVPSMAKRLPGCGEAMPSSSVVPRVAPRSTVCLTPFTVTSNERGFRKKYTPTPMAARITSDTTMASGLLRRRFWR